MRKNKLDVHFFFFLISGLSACSPVLYSTIQPVTPLPNGKGEIELGYGNTIYSSAYDGNFGLSLSGSYSFSDQYFVSANYLGWSGNIETDTSSSTTFFDFNNWDSDANIFEIGIGRYWINQDDRNWRYEITAGYGMGFINNKREDLAFTNSRYWNFFFQPAIGYKSKHLWLIGSLKFNYVNFRSLDWYFLDQPSNQVLNDFYDHNKRNFTVEPGISISLHFDPVILSSKYSWSSLNSGLLADNKLPLIMNRNLTISIAARFDLMKKSH